MNPNNDNNNPAVVTKTITDAVNEAHEWSAFVPFLFSDSPNELNVALIDTFSMVCVQPYEKDLHFQLKCKLSDESSFLTTCDYIILMQNVRINLIWIALSSHTTLEVKLLCIILLIRSSKKNQSVKII